MMQFRVVLVSKQITNVQEKYQHNSYLFPKLQVCFKKYSYINHILMRRLALVYCDFENNGWDKTITKNIREVNIFRCASSGVSMKHLTWWIGQMGTRKQQVKVSHRQLQAKNLSSFWGLERWKTLETFVFVFSCKSVKENFKRKKYIHISYIVQNSVDSVDSCQNSRILGASFLCCVPELCLSPLASIWQNLWFS